MGEFVCPAGQYLVFEDGPSETIRLQWATYRDASDQCSLSRIWGGIHPPMDDIPGRRIGMVIGPRAVAHAEQFFAKQPTQNDVTEFRAFPNPVACHLQLEYPKEGELFLRVFAADGRLVHSAMTEFAAGHALLDMSGLPAGAYVVAGFDGKEGKRLFEEKVVRY
jgi:hypothetical protein